MQHESLMVHGPEVTFQTSRQALGGRAVAVVVVATIVVDIGVVVGANVGTIVVDACVGPGVGRGST
jgi:hypothetical protein